MFAGLTKVAIAAARSFFAHHFKANKMQFICKSIMLLHFSSLSFRVINKDCSKSISIKSCAEEVDYN